MTEIQTTVKCCGAMHSTPFCPLCGKPFAVERPLASLLQHVARVATKQRAQTAGLRRLIENHPNEVKGWDDSRLAQSEAADAKWEAWRVALSEVVNPAREDN